MPAPKKHPDELRERAVRLVRQKLTDEPGLAAEPVRPHSPLGMGLHDLGGVALVEAAVAEAIGEGERRAGEAVPVEVAALQHLDVGGRKRLRDSSGDRSALDGAAGIAHTVGADQDHLGAGLGERARAPGESR